MKTNIVESIAIHNDTAQDTMCIRTGSEVLDSLNFNEDDFIFDIFMLVVLIVTLRVAAVLALLFKTRRGKKTFVCFG